MARTRARREAEAAATVPIADRLLAGAAELFRQKGYAGTTTRELSALLGLQNASLYYHMERKEDLLYRLCIVSLEDVAADLAAASQHADPLERLTAMFKAYVTRALRDRDRHATMLIELRALSEERRREVVAKRDVNVAVMREAFIQAQKLGQVRSDISPKLLTLAMLNLANWSIFWFRPDGEASAEEIADTLCDLLIDGVRGKGS